MFFQLQDILINTFLVVRCCSVSKIDISNICCAMFDLPFLPSGLGGPVCPCGCWQELQRSQDAMAESLRESKGSFSAAGLFDDVR